jgi:hypothetical protein
MDQILRMCEDTNYRDMTLIVSTVGYFSSRSAKHRIKFGKGWMGKDVEIRLVDYVYGVSKGILVFVTVSARIVVVDCWLENPKGRIHLAIGSPTDFDNWYNNPIMFGEEEEDRAELLEVWRERRKELAAEGDRG